MWPPKSKSTPSVSSLRPSHLIIGDLSGRLAQRLENDADLRTMLHPDTTIAAFKELVVQSPETMFANVTKAVVILGGTDIIRGTCCRHIQPALSSFMNALKAKCRCDVTIYMARWPASVEESYAHFMEAACEELGVRILCLFPHFFCNGTEEEWEDVVIAKLKSVLE